MKVFGVSNELRMLIKEQAARGDKTAQQALAELDRTNNGNEPQLAILKGENAIATMMSQLVNKSIEIQKAKMAQKIPSFEPDIKVTKPPYKRFQEPVATPKPKEKIFVPSIVPEEIPFLVPETEPVFKEKEKKIFEPFDLPETISKKIDESLEADTVMEKTILAKTAFTGVEPVITTPIAPDIKVTKPPYKRFQEADEVIIPETFYPGFDPEKITWVLNGNGETKRELHKAVIPIVIGLILYIIVWS